MKSISIAAMAEMVDISLVEAKDIRSKWQANFLQIFPLDFPSLPETHRSDSRVFYRHYRGSEKLTFNQFVRKYCWEKKK